MTNDEIKAEIRALEARQHRTIREGLLALATDLPAQQAAHDRLVAIEAQIKVLRAQLTPSP